MEWLVGLLPGAACVAMCAGCVWMMARGHRKHGGQEGEGDGQSPVASSEPKDG